MILLSIAYKKNNFWGVTILLICESRGIDSYNSVAVWFPNGFRVYAEYGPLDGDQVDYPMTTCFRGSHRECTLFDPDGNVISKVVEENPEKIPEEIYELMYSGG